MRRAFERILAHDGPTLVISHGAAMRLVLTELRGKPVAPLANGEIYRIDADADADADGRLIIDAWVDL
jgi:broad specificity phosphatase PhoE